MAEQQPATTGLDQKIEKCEKGKHDFEEIRRTEISHAIGEENILEWCKVCGVIRGKTEYDGRFPKQNWFKIPEAVAKLKSPK